MSDSKILAELRLQIEYVEPLILVANELNPQQHPDRQINALVRAINEVGFLFPVLIDGANGIVAGHARVLAAIKAGLAAIPIVRADHLNEHQLRAVMLADNRLSDLSKTDPKLLAENLKLLTVEGLDLDIESATAFTMGEIDVILEGLEGGADDDPDDAPVVVEPGPAVNRAGDVWDLAGRHRLICGSSLDAAAWDQLMDGHKATASCSDLPYNVKIRGNVSNRADAREFAMASGEMDRDEHTDFNIEVFRLIAKHSEPASIHMAFIDWRHLAEMQTAGEAVFSELKNVCVWDKQVGGMGSLYRSQHELIFVWKLGLGRSRNNVQLGKHGRNRTNVWSYPGVGTFRHSDEGDLLKLHVTPKPVRMIADAILDVTARGDIVIDAFLGSGTTIIAAERVGRRCFGLEIDPHFADIIVRRFERHSGEPAIHVATGKTFDEIGAERAATLDEEAA
ncbi:DNA methyltransferase [Sphingomonas sp. ASV193]|uniref:site-specific DNA-methyltransferase n=1 Tax=Sphingomonas sp. ASV193 TaxID=3144405 RepID=UPI0032E8E488